jgi:predicted phage tail protein
MVTVRYIENPFKSYEAIVRQIRYCRSSTVKDFIKEAGFDYEDKRIIVSGKKIENINIPIDNEDEIIVLPDVKGPVGAAIVAIGKAIGAYVLAHPFIATFAALSIGYSIYSYLSQPSLPNFNLGGLGDSLDEGSPTYGWDGVRTTQEVGVPVPIIYGEHKVGGNIINQYIRTDGDKHYFHVLLSLCEGEIESISNIKINDNPISNFDGITVKTRLGTNDQSLIPNFEDLHNLYTPNANLTKDNPYVYTTVDSDVEGFEIHFRCNNGLFQQDDSGDIKSWDVTYKIEYRINGTGAWIDLGSTTISAKSRSSLRRVFRKVGLSPDKYDIKVTRISDNSSLDPLKTGDLTLYQVDEIKTDDLIYPNTALLGIDALATDQLSGSMPNITSVVKGRKIRVPKIMNGAAEVSWEDYYWDSSSSQWKLLTDDTVLSWDGLSYATRYSANPVWCLRDLAVNNRYGAGEFISTANLSDNLLLEMAKYCEEKVSDGNGGWEKRFRLDVVIDSNTKALDLFIQLCAVFNAMPIYSAGNINFKIDKAASPSQLFGMGNIVKDSFTQSWKTIKEVPNVIEIQFTDKDNDYKQETIAYIDEAALNSGDPMRKKQIRLFTTRKSYAIRAGRYALKVAKYIDRTVSFKAGIEAVAAQAGDIISISHDVPQWGFSGRVKSGSTTTLVKLDQSVIIEADKTYKIQVRFSDDTIEERTVTDSAGTYTEVNVGSVFSQAPQAYDVYAFGESSKVKKDFRIISMQKEGQGEVQMSALEYDSNVYDDSAITLPANNYSSLSREIPQVTNLTLTERLVKLKDGKIENVIDVWYDRPDATGYHVKQFAKAKIYLSDNNGSSWQYRGESTSGHFQIIGDIKDGNTYKIAVVSVDDLGTEDAIANSPQASITVQGKTAPPQDVPAFEVSQTNDRLYFKITPVPDVDVSKYRIKRGPSWAEGISVADLIDVTEWSTVVGFIGNTTFWVKAIDTSGNESQNATKDTINIVMPPEKNVIEEMDLWSKNLEYKHAGTDYEWTNDYQGDFVRKTICIPTAVKWEDLDGAGTFEDKDGLEFDRPLISGRQYFTMAAPHDLGIIFEFEVFVDMTLFSWAIGVEINYSEDNISWSGWEVLMSGKTYKARFIKFRFDFEATDTSLRTRMVSLVIMYNAPALLREYGRDVLIPATGKTINLAEDYVYPPRVIVQVLGGGGAVFADVYNKTTSSFAVKVYDKNDNPVEKEIDWDAVGF